ncbi:EamA family transporter [Hyunsoonleella sp. SJ7]|uniref:EamA family transporter n=1 Tax=Hyunsoonleella aquatilis TaxID=2762758 RepID=A0A923H6I9_9FLAO|nr:DMT family transporter [Hyunsoonleella aquatilis]MBC3757066.1 EamA family transporter [Hyunsoonleella aquatilis]
MNNQHFRNVLELTLATVLISSAAVLGKYIAMPTAVIIWWRSALALIFLFAFCKLQKVNLKFRSKKDARTVLISALFLGAHWITYFHSVKVSNVSIGMLSLYTYPAITAILEPILTKTKFNKVHLLLAILVLIGVYILAPEFNTENSHFKGVIWGVISAILFTLRNIMLKRSSKSHNGTMIMMHQLLVVTIVLVPVLFIFGTSEISTQYPYVIILALLATAVGHSLLIKSLKYFSVSTASIILSTQPFFGILLAYFFLNEIPTSNTFIGGTLIISTVIIESIRSRK